MRPTRVEIDLSAVAENTIALRELVAPSQVCAVIKADAYGHGDVPVAEAALGAGAGWLAVALVEEGIRLREAGIGSPILLLSEPRPESTKELVAWDLTPTVYTEQFADSLGSLGRPVEVHVKVDTGMHRVGMAPGGLSDLITRLGSHRDLRIEGLWTHFAVADEDPSFTQSQIEMFLEVAARLEVPTRHLANTAGAVLFPQARADMCRIGLGIYGLHPCPETRDIVTLRPVMRMVSEVTHLQRLDAGARPSYGRIRALPKESTVATVPVGYADGFSRARTGHVLIGGRRCSLAGRVTMDQILVDVGDDEVSLGDEVILIGSQGGEEVTADEWADELGTVAYEIVCSIGPRVTRSYLP